MKFLRCVTRFEVAYKSCDELLSLFVKAVITLDVNKDCDGVLI